MSAALAALKGTATSNVEIPTTPRNVRDIFTDSGSTAKFQDQSRTSSATPHSGIYFSLNFSQCRCKRAIASIAGFSGIHEPSGKLRALRRLVASGSACLGDAATHRLNRAAIEDGSVGLDRSAVSQHYYAAPK